MQHTPGQVHWFYSDRSKKYQDNVGSCQILYRDVFSLPKFLIIQSTYQFSTPPILAVEVESLPNTQWYRVTVCFSRKLLSLYQLSANSNQDETQNEAVDLPALLVVCDGQDQQKTVALATHVTTTDQNERKFSSYVVSVKSKFSVQGTVDLRSYIMPIVRYSHTL